MSNISVFFVRSSTRSLKLKMTNGGFVAVRSADSYDTNIKETLNDGGELDKFTPMSLPDPPTGRGLYMITATLSKIPFFDFHGTKSCHHRIFSDSYSPLSRTCFQETLTGQLGSTIS